MPKSFTNAIRQETHFAVKPCLSMTFLDKEQTLQEASHNQSTLIRHFEVGLDGVPGIVHGQVFAPSSENWMRTFENRLNHLDSIMHDSGGHDQQFEGNQDVQGYGQGLWISFGIKFGKSGKDSKKSRWMCFGAPAKTFRRCKGPQDHLSVFHFNQQKGVVSRVFNIFKKSVRMSAGRPACMDLYEGSEVHEDVGSALQDGPCGTRRYHFVDPGSEHSRPKRSQSYTSRNSTFGFLAISCRIRRTSLTNSSTRGVRLS